MVGVIIPERLKNYVRAEFRWLMQLNFSDLLSTVLPCPQGFYPYEASSRSYLILKASDRPNCTLSPLPVPPPELRFGYGRTADDYLSSGKGDIQTMRRALTASGTPVESCQRILEVGCAAGRMIRWLNDLASEREIWGTDISASHVIWCQQHLGPLLHFVTTTIYPHLPFEDRYFDLIYAGSVFTHIDDLADAWFLELRRILRHGGRLYVTVHDRHTIKMIANDDRWWVTRFRDTLARFPEYEQFSRAPFGMFTIGRSVNSNVSYDTEFLAQKLEPFFRVLSATPEAYGYQTAVLLERL